MKKKIKKGVTKRGFKQSKVDECVYYKGKIIFFFYADNSIFLVPNEEMMKKKVEGLRK